MTAGSMTPRERLLTAMTNGQPDHVPAAPDMYEMVPVRLLGRPAWEPLVYQDPPVWKIRMDAAAHFGVDALFGIWVPMEGDGESAVVFRQGDKVITRGFWEHEGVRHWADTAVVYDGMEPSAHVKAKTIGLPDTHEDFEVVRPVYAKTGREHYEDARAYVGDGGIVAPVVSLPTLGCWEEDTYAYCEDPEARAALSRIHGEAMLKRAEEMLSWKPDFLFVGNSGMMLFNPPKIFRHLGLEWLQKVTKLAKDHGVPTNLHCCGTEAALVEMAANETDLDCIEPLEVPPMGDCVLKDIKQRFGHKIALKGNLHTTEAMLLGSRQRVEDACKRAIDDAGEGGGFILSTGDQTPRDTPEDNIRVMQEVAETYGRY